MEEDIHEEVCLCVRARNLAAMKKAGHEHLGRTETEDCWGLLATSLALGLVTLSQGDRAGRAGQQTLSLSLTHVGPCTHMWAYITRTSAVTG